MCVDRMYVYICVSVSAIYLNQPTDMHHTYENCASVAGPNALFVSFLQPIITTWQTREI